MNSDAIELLCFERATVRWLYNFPGVFGFTFILKDVYVGLPLYSVLPRSSSIPLLAQRYGVLGTKFSKIH